MKCYPASREENALQKIHHKSEKYKKNMNKMLIQPQKRNMNKICKCAKFSQNSSDNWIFFINKIS